MKDTSVTEYIKKAFEYKETGNFKQAIEFFYKALSIDNESSEIMNEIAGLYFKINNTDRAIEYYEQALMTDPFNSRIKSNLALVYKHIGNVDKAINLLESVYSKQSKVEYLSELLQCLYLEEKYEEVVHQYKRSNFKDTNLDSIHYYTGLAYYELNDFESAEGLFRKALNSNSDNQDAKYYLARVLYEKESYDEAELLLLNILEDKICAKSYFLIGEINFAKDLLEKSISYFSIACNIESGNPSYFYSLATVYSLKGFLSEAEENYIKAIKLSPNNLHYNYTLAYLYYQTGKFSKAKHKLSYILSINSYHIDALVLKALLYADVDDVVNANRILDDVLSKTTTNDFAYYVKAIVCSKMNWWDKAIEIIKKALELKPDSLEYMSELAKYYYENKMYKDARATSYKILEFDQKYVFAYLQLSKVFIKLDDFETALKNIEIAISLDNNSDEAYYMKAIVMKKSEIKNFAIENAKIAISLAPHKVKYYEFIAEIYFSQEKYKDAYSYFKEAASLDIAKGDYRYYMAKCSEFIKDTRGAIINFAHAKRLNPANVFVTNEYSNFLLSVGKEKQALEVLKSTLAYNIDSSERKELNKKIASVEKSIIDKSDRFKKWFKSLLKTDKDL